MSRRQMLRRAGVGLAALAAGDLLAACGGSSSSSATSSAANAGRLEGPLASQFWATSGLAATQSDAAVKTAGRQLGLEVISYSYDFNNDKQLAQLDQMGVQGVRAAGLCILDNSITRQVAESARRNQLYVGALAQLGQWVFPSESSIDYHYQGIGTTPDGAYVLCTSMFRALGGRGNFVNILGPAGSATGLAKSKAVHRALEEFPDIRLVAEQRGNADRETTRTVVSNILAKTGNRVDAIYCMTDDSAVGALDALRSVGLVGRTLVAGADGIPEMLDAIAAGNAFATEAAVSPFLGTFCSVMALDAAAGYRPNPLESLLVGDLIIIDNRASAEAYRELVYGPRASSLFDVPLMSRVLHPRDWDPQHPVTALDPEAFWAVAQGVPKPEGFTIPEAYTEAEANGGRARIDRLYASHLRKFALRPVVELSDHGKTALGNT